MKEALGIYVHIPYCLKKCRYCDFFSEPLSKASVNPQLYIEDLCLEIHKKAKEYENRYYVDTIFFGGGTPTCIEPVYLDAILRTIRRSFEVADYAEITTEANPETISLEYANELKAMGFNRISMGVQSLNDDVLKLLGRVHSADKALESYQILRKAGFNNINLDLMFGLPGQSFETWKSTLDSVFKLSPEHISFYSLQLEEGTALYDQYRNGEIDIPSWEENREMYHNIVSRLKEQGYEHYEVSNAAKPGFYSRHNLKYWTMKPYLGFGKTASSFIDGKRTEDQNPDLETDWLFTGLRLVNGTDFGKDICDKYESVISKLASEKLIIKDGTVLKFTEKGLDNTNNVLEEFLNYESN